MTLVEFLLARIDEDEALAVLAKFDFPAYKEDGSAYVEGIRLAADEGARRSVIDHFGRFDPEWVIADCQSKRRIVRSVARMDGAPEAWAPVPATGQAVLSWLVAPYAWHDDFDPAWTAATRGWPSS